MPRPTTLPVALPVKLDIPPEAIEAGFMIEEVREPADAAEVFVDPKQADICCPAAAILRGFKLELRLGQAGKPVALEYPVRGLVGTFQS